MVETIKGAEFRNQLIRDYEYLARNARMQVSLLHQAREIYYHSEKDPSNYINITKELIEFRQDAIYFQAMADEMRGAENGHDIREATVSGALLRETETPRFKRIECTTVL